MTEPVAVCSNVAVEYGDGGSRVRALDGVEVSVAPGERVALRGRSGSGKTTLLHVFGGLVSPTRGSVRVASSELTSLDEDARRRIRAQVIAYVFQGANLLPTFTAYENVAFAARGTANPDLGPNSLLRLVGLADKADHLPDELSGGEAQRVAIARAIAQRPVLLLCDEPTGQLDSDTAERVLDLLDALQRQFGFAVLTATHDEGVARRSDRVVELEDGKVVT